MTDTTRDQLIAVMIEADTLRKAELAEAILAAGWRPPPRVITTEAELDALPVGAIAFDQEEPPNAHSKRESGDWYAPGSLSVTSYELLLWSDGAVTLLHEPKEGQS